MSTNKIDEIIINGLKESERRNEILAKEAKPRVWDAIVKPNSRKTVNWWFVSAMAAAISMFLISTFLFLKLESQKKELFELQTYVRNEISPKESTYVMVLPAEEQIIEKKPTIIQESIPIVKNVKIISETKNREREVDEGVEVFSPIISKPNLALLTLSKPEIDLPEIFDLELNPKVAHIPELIKETFIEPKQKKQTKLRLKFGNGNIDHDYQNTYALNIRL
ncbi:hypothetical protein [Aquiflexum sp.]|uniref:hypothetical protein n=1 Tax=Aquiflexum sp. TaxID=1872584 RepID=UPI0035931B95